jgi:ribosomal protein S18 acetylase RimI-like enzyme
MSNHEQEGASWGQIAVYGPEMAPRVAAMFNAFDELWPGGFAGRVPYDEQRVRDWLDDTSAIADLIALDVDGDPVGYCGLYPHWRDKHAAYISVLGVVPRVKGHKYGKRMLLRAIEIAYERGISRVDLHTWSGNLNAMPLYKKIGMFWVPETSVYMQDYIPGLLRMPLASEWFERHPDWYGCFVRSLEQAPDKHVIDGMELYRYVFEEMEDRLVAEVDRYGWGFCGIEQELGGRRLAVRTRLQSHEIQIGIPNAMTISVENGKDEPVSVALMIEPFPGLAWGQAFPLTLDLPAHEQASVTRTFTVDRTAETYKGEASEAVRSRILLDGRVLDLVTGGKIQPAVELMHQDGYCVASPGRGAQIYLDLDNHAGAPVVGEVRAFVEGIPGSQQVLPYAVGEDEVSGVGIPLALPATAARSSYTLHATAVLEYEGDLREMPEYRLPVVPDVDGLVAVVQVRDEDHVHLLTDQLDVSVDLEGGTIHIGRRSLPGPWQHVSVELGPPYGLNLDRTLKYAWETQREGDALTLTLRAESRQVAGLMIGKHVRVRPGTREVEYWAKVSQLQPGGSISIGARVHPGGHGGFTINPFASVARIVVPLGDRILEADAALDVVNENVIPQEAAAWKETWAAVRYRADSSLSAWFWKPQGVSKVKMEGGALSSLEIEPVSLQPGESTELCHLWFGLGYARVSEVRARWGQLVGAEQVPYRERTFGPDMVAPLAASLVGEKVLYPGTNRRTVELAFATGYPFEGELRLGVPDGWEAAFVTAEGPRPMVSMPEPTSEHPAAIEIEVTVPEENLTASATVELQFRGELEMRFPLSVLVAQHGQVQVAAEQLSGQPVMTVSNGALHFAVCTSVGGNLIRLQDAEGRTYLYDQFPEVKPYLFFTSHIGGAEPIAFWPSAEDPFEALEEVTVERVEEGSWAGVRASWVVQRRERLRGQRYSVSYLVLPGCPVIRVRLAHENPTPRRLRWVGGLMLNLALQGDLEETVLHVPGGTQSWTRHRTPMPFFGQPDVRQPWAWAGKEDSSLTMFVPRGEPGSIAVLDLGALIAGLMFVELETGPLGFDEIEFGLALNQPRERTQELIQALEV